MHFRVRSHSTFSQEATLEVCKLKRHFLIFYSVILLFFLSLVSWTFAFFSQEETHPIIIEKGTFNVYLYVSFDTLSIDASSPYYDMDTQTIIVNAHDALSPNYIGKLKVSVEVDTKIPAYLRISLMDEWELKRTFNPSGMYPMDPVYESIYIEKKSSLYYPYTLLKKHEGYTPKFRLDGYAYHPNLIEPGTHHIDLIHGGDPYPVRENDIYVETCTLKLGIQVEIIQANRVMALWGVQSDFFD